MADPSAGTPAFRETGRQRASILTALADGPMTQRELRDAPDVCRPTMSTGRQDALLAELVGDAAAETARAANPVATTTT